MNKKINIALVGLGFGGAFAKIYKYHPNVQSIGIYDINQELMKNVSDYAGIEKMYGSFDEILNEKDLDAVHLVTPIPQHEEQTAQVLESGKHCA